MTTGSGPWDAFVPSSKLIECITRSLELLWGKSCDPQEIEDITPTIRIVIWRLCGNVADMLASRDGIGSTYVLTASDFGLEESFAGSLIHNMWCPPTEHKLLIKEVAGALLTLARDHAYASNWWSLEILGGHVVLRLKAYREDVLVHANWRKRTFERRM